MHASPAAPLASLNTTLSSIVGAGTLFRPMTTEEAQERGLGEVAAPEERGLGPEAGSGQVAGGPAGNVMTMNCTGTAQGGGALAYDQFWFFSLLADTPIDPGTYAIGTVDVQTEDGLWTPAMIAQYLGLEPLFLVNANITGASAAAVLSGMSLRVKRTDPFGTTAGSFQPNAAYQTAADFQVTRAQFPIAEVVDGWTWCRLVSPIQVAAATFTVAWFWGPRTDRRAAVPRVSPQLVRSVNK